MDITSLIIEAVSGAVGGNVAGAAMKESCGGQVHAVYGQRPELIKLNLVIEGRGKVSMKDVQLLKTPLRS